MNDVANEIAKDTVSQVTNYATNQEPIVFIAIILIIFILCCGVVATGALVFYARQVAIDAKDFFKYLKDKIETIWHTQELHIQEANSKKLIIESTEEVCQQTNTIVKAIARKLEVAF